MIQTKQSDLSANERLDRERIEIIKSGLFDGKFYLSTYPDIARAKCDPLNHFLLHGAKEGRRPHPLFDCRYYDSLYGQDKNSANNPLLHFLKEGYKQNCSPHPLFDMDYYYNQAKDFIGDQNPLLHFLEYGYQLGLDPHPLFNTAYYCQQLGDSISNQNALSHFLQHGVKLGLNPHPLFDINFYLEQNPQLRATSTNPLEHFIQSGAKENRNPHPLFDSSYYWQSVPYEQKFTDNPLLHFLKEGHKREYNPHPLFDINHYLEQATDLSEDENPLIHFLQKGYKKELNPHLLFDSSYYHQQAGNTIKHKNALLFFLKHGNQLKLSPHKLFDLKFYLSKYPDIRKGKCNALVHFVCHGAREYRWPNADFDPLYYSKIVPHAYANNFLLHYLTVGQFDHIPTHGVEHLNYWRIPESAARLCRRLLFILLSFFHSFRRNHIEALTNYDHQLSSYSFFCRTVSRFWQGCGLTVKFTVPSYLNQPKRLEQPLPHQWLVFKYPIAFAHLYLANVFKEQGFFADAIFILEKLTRHAKINDLALCSLGDLYLLEAIWSSEFRDYENDGIVFNVFPHWRNNSITWHNRTFDEALAILQKTLDINNRNTDAQWLLCYGLLTDKQYAKALKAIQKYPGQKSENIERRIWEQRAHYGLDRNSITNSSLFPLNDKSRRMLDLNLVSTCDIQPLALAEKLYVLEPMDLSINSKTVGNLQLTVRQHTLKFQETYLCKYGDAEILPEYGILAVHKYFFIKESCHMKTCHAPLFNSCIQEITNLGALIVASNPASFKEENCIYIGCNNNFYHWLIDELPRLSLIETSKLFMEAPVLIDKKAASWQYELLAMMGVAKDHLRPVDFGQPTSFRNLIVPSRLSRDMVAHPAAVSFMRNRLLSGNVDIATTKGKRIYATRTGITSTGRVLLNQSDVVSKFRKANFQIVDPTLLSIKEQAELFSDAEIIAGPVGAALTNILFAPKNAKVLSLGPNQFIGETYTSLACAIGQESWSIRGTSFARPYPNLIWTNFDYEINEKDIDFCFDHIL